jgi:hypothetical protein
VMAFSGGPGPAHKPAGSAHSVSRTANGTLEVVHLALSTGWGRWAQRRLSPNIGTRMNPSSSERQYFRWSHAFFLRSKSTTDEFLHKAQRVRPVSGPGPSCACSRQGQLRSCDAM